MPGWNSLCSYLLKEGRNPTVWGEEPLELVRERARSAANKRRGPDLAKLMRSKNTWKEVMEDDALMKKCLSSYSSVRSTFTDLQSLREGTHFLDSLLNYVKEHGGEVYWYSELGERLVPFFTDFCGGEFAQGRTYFQEKVIT